MLFRRLLVRSFACSRALVRAFATTQRSEQATKQVDTTARPHEGDIGDDEGPALTTECPKVPHPVLDPVSRDVHAGREAWSKDHADIVLFMHALKVELTVQHIMRLVVHETDHEPFQYWLRFEFGTNTGNPHAHGMAYAAQLVPRFGPPSFKRGS